jgi:N,N-dimethylformamidase
MTDDRKKHRLLGYSDRLSARQGEKLLFFVSAPRKKFKAEVHRIRSVDGREGAGGVRHEVVSSRLAAEYSGDLQVSSIGSHAEFVDPSWHADGSSVLTFAFWPTLLPNAEEALVAFNGSESSSALVLSGGAVHLCVGSDRIASAALAVSRHAWFRVALRVHAGVAQLTVGSLTALGKLRESSEIVATIPVGGFLPRGFNGSVSVAAQLQGSLARNHFSGKIAEVTFFAGLASDQELRVVLDGADPQSLFGTRIRHAWALGRNTASFEVPSVVEGAASLRLVNLPVRAVTGSLWRGTRDHPELAPDEYNAVMFHRDMVAGGDWRPSLELEVESEWRSGAYALRLHDGVDEDWIPFYVRPGVAAPRARVLFLAATNTYLAYANERRAYLTGGFSTKEGSVQLQDADWFVEAHPELGLSLYNKHQDGSGVVYASRLRPLLNFRPFHVSWLTDSFRHYAGDFYLLDWLEQHGFEYDVLTDEDLHLEGVSALQPYSVVITGSHPEYASQRMMESLQEYSDAGGNLMYLGGNGFYWVTSFHPEMPHVIEVRRGPAGMRNYTSPPGESVHATTGELGSLWRHRARSPNRLTGIGTGAVGWAKAGPYVRSELSRSAQHAWIFDGVDDGPIGDSGMMLGGAAGDELDRVDHLQGWGTPPGTVVLASSVDLSTHYQPVAEDYSYIFPGEQGGSANPLVRADMTWLSTSGGGAVFSVGSICWIGCLPVANYANPVSRITLNVLKRFVS